MSNEKTSKLQVTLTHDERAELAAEAKKASLPLATYIRTKALEVARSKPNPGD